MLLSNDRSKATRLLKNYENRRTRGICTVFKHIYPDVRLTEDTVSPFSSISIVAHPERLNFVIGTALDCYDMFERKANITSDNLNTSLVMIQNTNGTCQLKTSNDYMKALVRFQFDNVTHAQQEWLEQKVRLYQKMILPVPTNGATIETTIGKRFNRQRLSNALDQVLEAEMALYDGITLKYPEFEEMNRKLKYITGRVHTSELNYFFPPENKQAKCKQAKTRSA